MKKKVLTTLLAFFAVTVMACTPSKKDNSEKSEEPEVSSVVEECKKHTWGKWETEQEFPCVEGTKTRVCEVCGKVETQVVAAGAHDFSLPVVTTPATDKEGVAKQTCSVCGHEEEIAVLPTQSHSWAAATVDHAQGDDEVDASYETCGSCQQMRITWGAQDANKEASSGFTSAGKFTDTGDYVNYKFYSPSAMKARLWVKIADRSSDSPYNRQTKEGNQGIWYDYYNGPGFKYGVKVNNADLDQEKLKPVMIGNEVVSLSELTYSDFTITSSELVAAWFTFDVKEGQNIIHIERSLGYSVSVKEFYVIGA